MLSRRFQRGSIVALVAALSLSACDVSQQTTQNQQPAPQAQNQTRSQQNPTLAQQPQTQQPQTQSAPQAQQPQTQQPQTANSGGVGGLTDQQIGSGGVAAAQTRPTPIANNDQNLVSEYERVINNVYERNIGALVNLSDGQVTGSGFIVDTQGHIITNNHVASNLQQITITFSDRTSGVGKLVGAFAAGDIAVIQADHIPNGVQPVELGDSGNLKVGQITVAMGSPLGLEQTVTSGIISALNRSIDDVNQQATADSSSSSLQGLIQTDAPINPGNSGGPLFDSHGRVIGMDTLIATRATSEATAGSIGLGFAVPINRIKRVAQQIIQTGHYNRPVMGISSFPIDPRIARVLNLPVTSGIMVAKLTGPQAQQAGLRAATTSTNLQASDGSQVQFPTNGDIIVAINNTPVRTTGDLRNVIETQANPGDTVTITFVRDGREQTTRLTLK
ncbi:MAG: trypsin-like peptidase domain-containing protein [Herpetosiphonaceae bacterium]|nr:trypsin-like peptidase domain-containing protein [Herpetosiphonaceae bacterium]